MGRRHRTERTILKLLLIPLAGLILLIGIGIVGHRSYQQWEGHRLTRRAEAFFNSGDFKSATLTAQRAVQLSQSNVGAYRILARIAEHEGQSSAIDLREAALAANPGSSEDLIALAQSALQFNRTALAETALAKLENAADQKAAYHEGEAQLAVVKKNPIAAEEHFAQAVKLEPSNKTYQFNLAAFHLQSASSDVRASARKQLQMFANDKELRLAAARTLRDYAAQSKNLPALVEIGASLYRYPEATFRDRLSYIQVLHALSHPDFAGKLKELQDEAVNDSNKLTELLSWMAENGLAVFGIHWTKELRPEVVNQRPVPVAVADCYVSARDWSGLEQWCNERDWRDLKFAMHAYLSKSMRERGNEIGSQSEWNLALHEAGSNGERIYSLEQATAKWGWQSEAEELLWMLTNYPDKQNEAFAALSRYYLLKGDTGNLYRVAARACKAAPNDESAQNNLAQLSLLLKINTDHAHELAAGLYQKNSTNPVCASTYGFSLYTKGQPQKAVQVMSQLSPDDLAKPAVAAYYGVFLAAVGNGSKAMEYLKIGMGAPLLPEEKALIENAQKKIGVR